METTIRLKISELPRAETRLRIRKAFENVKKGKSIVSFTHAEFEKYTDAMAAKYRK